MLSKPFSVKVGVCAHRDIKVATHGKLWALRECPNIDISPIIQDGDALICRSRNRVATHFLKNTTADYLFFLDDDIVIETMDATRMMWDAFTSKFQVLGAAYPIKSQEKPTMAIMTKDKVGSIPFGTNGAILEVDCVSTGCMLIDRKVLEEMVLKEVVHFCKQGYYTFFQHREEFIDGAWDDQSEDWFFCRNAQKIGISIYLDTRPKVKHVGPFSYDWDYMMLNGQFKKFDEIIFNYDLAALPPGESGEVTK